jgi:diguanylate cyclase (GGDEF)-like protein
VPKYERRLVKKDGGLLAAEVSSAMVYDPQGNPLYIQSIVRDITDQRKTEEHLKSQLTEMVTLAATDPLTGLHNRRTMRNYAENLLRQAWIRKEPFSLVLIDLDDLKAINDRHGHESGDFALLHLSKTLVKNMRSSDLSGRWAGDEFLLLLPGAGIDSAAATAERLLVKINQDPIKLEGGEEFRVEICMGVAGTESRAEGVYDLDKMVNMADKAMYSAKQAGGNQVKLYVE